MLTLSCWVVLAKIRSLMKVSINDDDDDYDGSDNDSHVSVTS